MGRHSIASEHSEDWGNDSDNKLEDPVDCRAFDPTEITRGGKITM